MLVVEAHWEEWVEVDQVLGWEDKCTGCSGNCSQKIEKLRKWCTAAVRPGNVAVENVVVNVAESAEVGSGRQEVGW